MAALVGLTANPQADTDMGKEGIVNNTPRRPWLAALLTLFEIGLGHIYSGNFQKGLILFCLDQFLFLVFVASLIVIAPNPFYMIFALVVGFAFTVYCVADAALIAKRNKKNYVPAKYNRWFVYVGYILMTGILVQMCTSYIVTPNLIQAYKMPTGSMEPTLLVGDHILINKHIYKVGEPKRGEVIVFRYPLKPDTPYVKRLIGEPGDTLEMIGRTVYINGKPIKENYTQYVDPGSINNHYGPYRVPSDQYFVMGDNRDSSQDSRFWGFVPRKNLLGKPLVIYWSFETGRDEYLTTGRSVRLRRFVDNVLHFFDKTRWDRTFRVIE
jgi:signal peptidase I